MTIFHFSERRLVPFASKLEDLLSVLSGHADEPTRELIAAELLDPHSEASILAKEIRVRVSKALHVDWRRLDEGKNWQEFVDAIDAVEALRGNNKDA